MEVTDGNQVTASGESETQMPAVGSEQVGSRGSSSNDHRTTGVDSQAPVSLNATSAGAAGQQVMPPDKQTNEPAASQPTRKVNSPKLQDKLTASSTRHEKEPNLQTVMTNLKNVIKKQFKALNSLLTHIEHLEVTREKTKSPTVANAIDDVLDSTEALKSTTNSVHSAFCEAEKAAARVQKQPENQANLANHEAILKVCEDIKARVNKQQEDINEIKSTMAISATTYASKTAGPQDRENFPQLRTDTPDGETRQGQPTQPWKKVNRKKTKNNATKKLPPEKTKIFKRPLPDSISVKPENGETYSGILKAIKEKVDITAIGSQVSSITESRNGEIIIKLNHEDKKKEDLINALKTNLGDRAVIRGRVHQHDVDIQDLDSVTSEAEVEGSIRSALGLPADDTSITVKNIRPAYANTQRATVD